MEKYNRMKKRYVIFKGRGKADQIQIIISCISFGKLF